MPLSGQPDAQGDFRKSVPIMEGAALPAAVFAVLRLSAPNIAEEVGNDGALPSSFSETSFERCSNRIWDQWATGPYESFIAA